MSREKSKELYAKTILSAMGNLDDDLIAEAHDAEQVTVQSAAFRLRRYLPRIAASFLVLASLVLIVLLARQAEYILPLVSRDGEATDAFAQEKAARVELSLTGYDEKTASATLTFTGLADTDLLLFAVESESGAKASSVLYGGAVPETVEKDGVTYYRVNVKGLDRVSVTLSGVTDPQDVKIRFSAGKEEATVRPSV